MKKIKSFFYFLGTILPMLLFSCNNRKANTSSTTKEITQTNIAFHDLKIKSLLGDSIIDMSQFKGKKVLIVNVASKCGYTPQYKDLETLNDAYQDQLVIIGCPCNQFLGQEPGTAEDIAQFCSLTYDVSFRLTEKLDVMGKDQHPLYQWLTQKENNKKEDYKVSWNFNKFLIDENGNLLAHFGSKTNPMSEEITSLL